MSSAALAMAAGSVEPITLKCVCATLPMVAIGAVAAACFATGLGINLFVVLFLLARLLG